MGDSMVRRNESRRSKPRPSRSSISSSSVRRSKPGTSLSKRRTSMESSSPEKTEVNILKFTRPGEETASIATNGLDKDIIDEVEDDVPVEVCTACVRDNRKSDATHYCKDCGDNMCSNCVHQHQKFAAMKNHVVEPLPGKRGKVVIENPLKCDQHNKDLDMFCEDCDEVYCAACIAMNHRDCQKTVYLPIVAKHIAKSEQFMTVYENVNKTKADIETLKCRRKEDMLRLGKEREDAVVRVKYIRKTMETYLDNLEKVTLEKLQIEFEKFKQLIENDIHGLNEILQKLSVLSNQLTNANTMNESHLFIQLRSANKAVKEGTDSHNRLTGEVGKEQIQFIPDSKLMEYIQTYPSLGHFASEQRLFTSSLLGQYDVHQGSDVTNAQIISCAVLQDGKVLLSDWDNKKVKLLTNDYKIADNFKVPSAPYGICAVNQHEAITCLTNKKVLQYLSIDSRCKILEGKTLKINEFCRDVDFHNETIFVVCCSLKDGGVCRINLFDQNGQLLRKIEADTEGRELFKRAQYLAVNSIGNVLVSDEDVGIMNIDDSGTVTSTFTHKSLKYPFGVAMVTNDQALVCGFGSHNIVQFGRNGVMLGEILQETAGMRNPRSIAFDVHRQRIIIACKHSNIIRVFKLH